MDNIQDLAESRPAKKASSYESATSLAAFLSLLEFLEVWGCGWTLLTLLTPEEFPNLWQTNNDNGTMVAVFHNIPLRNEYMMCVLAYLAFYLLFAVVAFLVLCANWYNRVTPFIMYPPVVVLSILLGVAVTIYFLANDHEKAFLFVMNPKHEDCLPYLFLLLYFSRYFAVGWILKIAFVSCTSQRRNRLEEEKDIQGQVDKAFKTVFDSVQPKDSTNKRSVGKYYGEDDSGYDRPPSVPEFVRKIPRIRLSHADADGQRTNGYINKGFEHDARSESLYTRPKKQPESKQEPRYTDDKVIYMKRNSSRDSRDYTVVDLRPKHRRSRSEGPYGEAMDQRHSYPEDLRGQHLNAAYQDDDGALTEPPMELGGLSRSDDNIRSGRPLSGYSLREGFGYGPGPRGYDVPSPHSRPRNVEHQQDRTSGLKREESLVRRLSARYEENNEGLRSGPAPTGGVPAIGPASIRRVPARSVAPSQYY